MCVYVCVRKLLRVSRSDIAMGAFGSCGMFAALICFHENSEAAKVRPFRIKKDTERPSFASFW